MSRITTRCSKWTSTTTRRIWKKQKRLAEKRSSRRWKFPRELLRGCKIPKAIRSVCGRRRSKKSRNSPATKARSAGRSGKVGPHNTRKPGTYKNKKSKALEDAGGAHAASNAHGDHAVAPVAALQFANDSSGKFCAGATKRMSERDGAAVGIDARGVQTCLLDNRERLSGEGFVEFDDSDV